MIGNPKKENRIIFICWLAYAVAYIGRLNYSASIVAIIAEMGIEKTQAGLVSSFFFFAYGIGQLVNGILSKKYNSRVMVFISLTVSSVLNLIMPLCGDITIMKYVWLLNGAVQSILWSTLIKTISEHVSDKKMPTAIFVMSTTNTFGTFVVYGLSALFVKFFSWRLTFFFASASLIATAILWFTLYGNEKPVAKTEEEKKAASGSISRIMIASIALIAFAGIANGFIKDGINTWVPSVLYEEFGVSQSFSILLTLLLPLLSTLSAGIIKKLHEKIASHSTMNWMLFALSAIFCTVVLLALKIHSIVLVMACFIGVACLMAMINNVITSMFPLDNRARLGSGFAAGLLNTFCYVGSTTTSYSLAAVSQRGGWNSVFIIMAAVSVGAVIVSLAGSVAEKKSLREN